MFGRRLLQSTTVAGVTAVWASFGFIVGDSATHCAPNNNSIRYFTREEVKASKGSKRTLTTYRDGVYDITDFIDIHPGGDEIERCYGGPVDKYFDLFPHHEKQHVLETLEEYRIGTLKYDDQKPSNSSIKVAVNSLQTKRRTKGIKKTKKVDFDPDRYEVGIYLHLSDSKSGSCIGSGDNSNSSASGSGNNDNLKRKGATLRVAELKHNFPVHSLRVGIACGLAEQWRGRWAEELIAKGGPKIYTGVWLGDVVSQCLGLDVTDERQMESLYVHYHCYDDYVDSIPLGRCLQNKTTSLLVYEIEGKQLTTHTPFRGGGPLMALTVGSNSKYPCDAKWITNIVISADPGNARHGGKYGPEFS